MSRGLLSHVLLAESADMSVDVLGVLRREIPVSYLQTRYALEVLHGNVKKTRAVATP